MSTAYILFIQVFTYMGSFAGGIASLILGILALVPSGPFVEQDVTLGVVLIVLSITGITGLAGALAGAISGAVIGIPVYFSIRD